MGYHSLFQRCLTFFSSQAYGRKRNKIKKKYQLIFFHELSNAACRVSLASPEAELEAVFKRLPPAGRGGTGDTAARALLCR